MTFTAGERPLQAKRWYVKKAARAAFSAICAPAALAGLFDMAPGVRVLTYHRFGDDPRAPFTVSAASFERQMAALAGSGTAVSLNDVRAFLVGTRDLPRNATLVTIDDGDPSVLRIAAPILQKHGVPAVAFVLGGTPAGFSVMTPSQLRALADAGVDIESHSVSHASLARLSSADMRREAVESRQRIEDMIGRPVTAFAYPFGTRRDYSDDAANALREAGYTLAFTSQHGPVRRGMDSLMLPRVKVESGDPDWHFDLLRRGGMDAWRLVDGSLYRLQRPAAPAER
jgi:peptidoglycan/xylan/chitin deacetylase (PgdA/CDA1 family)